MERSAESLAREAIEDFNRLAWAGVIEVDEQARSFWVEEPVIVPFRAALEGNEYRGPTALEDFTAASAEAWERLRVDPVRVEELADGSALVYAEMTTVARETGIETKAPIVLHMVTRGGLIASLRTFLSEADALRAVGR